MDDRSREIREGAGLDESRVNTELLELINKYSGHVLLGLAVIVGLYAGKQWLDQRGNTKVNEAFAQHVDITETASPRPESLSALAQQYGDVRGIGAMARLREADVYLQAVATGMRPGSTFELDPDTQQQTNQVAETDLITDAERDEMLSKADALYDQVIETASLEIGPAIHTVGAWFGKAAVAESRGDDDAAKAAYASAKQAAETAAFPMYAALADQRIASIEQGLADITLIRQSDLPEIPEPETADLPEPDGPAAPVLDAPVGPTLPADTPSEPAGTELEVIDPDQAPNGDADNQPGTGADGE
ncbi:MAG: hypothetical protein AAGJ54_06545 [Planctomycetota bacterium]